MPIRLGTFLYCAAMVLGTQVAAQTPVQSATEALHAFVDRETELIDVDGQINAAIAQGQLENRDLEARRTDLYGQYRQAAMDMAKAFEALDEASPASAESDMELVRWYYIATGWRVSNHCGEAFRYYGLMRSHPLFAEYEIEGHRLTKIVRNAEGLCRSGELAQLGNSFAYDGKAAYIFEQFGSYLVESRPYSNIELERLNERVFGIDQVDEATAAFAELTGGAVLAEPPFILVAGVGDYQAQALRPQKILPGEEGGILIGDRADELRMIYDQVVGPVADMLSLTYFDKAKPQELIPIFLAGGSLGGAELRDYVGLCMKVHFRSCGLRVGYYLPYDNSVLVWLATGGGTLSHEMTHALMRADFPDAPEWVAEGLASLHEELADGFRPLDNYRQYYLRATLERFGHLVPIETLLAIPAEALGDQVHVKLYAAYSRYLNLYLWEKQALPVVYKQIRDLPEKSAAAQVAVLEERLGMPVASIQDDWENWLRAREEPGRWGALRQDIFTEAAELDGPPW